MVPVFVKSRWENKFYIKLNIGRKKNVLHCTKCIVKRKYKKKSEEIFETESTLSEAKIKNC